METIIHGFVIRHWSVCGNHGNTGSGAKVGRQELAIRAQLPQASSDKHWDVRRAVVIGAMNLRMIAERTNIIRQVQHQRPFDFIRAEVGKLSIHAGKGLRLDVVLF